MPAPVRQTFGSRCQVVARPGFDELQSLLAAARDAVGDEGERGWAWASPERVRLVLVHVGEVPEARLAAVRESIAAAARAVEPLALEATAIALGPEPRAVRRLDVVVSPSPALSELVRRLSARLVSPARRGSSPYAPAIAVARLQAPRAQVGGPWPLAEPVAFGVARVELVSTRESRGATSEVVVASAALGQR